MLHEASVMLHVAITVRTTTKDRDFCMLNFMSPFVVTSLFESLPVQLGYEQRCQVPFHVVSKTGSAEMVRCQLTDFQFAVKRRIFNMNNKNATTNNVRLVYFCSKPLNSMNCLPNKL